MKLSLISFWFLIGVQIILQPSRKESTTPYKKATTPSAIKNKTSVQIATDPVEIDCAEVIRSGSFERNIQRLSGVVEDNQPELPALNCLSDAGNWNAYAVNQFSVTASGTYALELDAEWTEAFGALFLKELDCYNLVTTSKAKPAELGLLEGEVQQITVFLQANKTYLLLSSPLDTDFSTASQNFDWVFYSTNNEGLANIPSSTAAVRFRLWCSGVDSVLNNQETLEAFGTLPKDATDVYIELNDALKNGGGCAADTIHRLTVLQQQGVPPIVCKQKVVFEKPEINDIILPPRTVHFSCDEELALNDDGFPVPTIAGFPAIKTAYGIRRIRNQYCNILVSYTDKIDDKPCPNSTYIIREWTLLDWCNQENNLTFSQLIKIGDFEAPEFDLPIEVNPAGAEGEMDTLLVSTGPFNCTSTLPLPTPQNIRDNCSANTKTKVILTTLDGDTIALKQVNDQQELVFDRLEIGKYFLFYQVNDDCFNIRERQLLLIINDQITPVAICNDDLNISIGGNGIGSLSVEDISEGSWDNCTADPYKKARRVIPEECLQNYVELTGKTVIFDEEAEVYYSEWDEKVYFTCCDVDRMVRIELFVEDQSGNSNSCWMDVLIEDKLEPDCFPPQDTIVDCDLFSSIDLTDTDQLQARFGVPVIEDNFCSAFFTEFEPTLIKDVCNTGTIIRRFVGTDLAGNTTDTCFQEITANQINNYEIKLPKDVDNFTCQEIMSDTIMTKEIGCDLLAVSRDTTIYRVDNTLCLEWRIRHRIINWCEFNDDPQPVRISRNEDRDDEIGEDNVFILVREDSAFIDNDNDETNGFLRKVESTGFWEYTQVVSVLDTLSPELILEEEQTFCAEGDDCIGRVDVFFTLFDLCDSEGLDITVFFDENKDGNPDEQLDDDQVTGRVPKFRISGDFPQGDHCFRIEVIDGCGNFVETELRFQVVDCKAPAPVCVEQLAVELMPVVPPGDVDGNGTIDRGSNVIWASDFRPKVNSDDCSPEIRYSINRVGEMPNVDSVNLVLTCDDLGILPVEVYAWDMADNPMSLQPDGTMGGPNYDFCRVFVEVQDNRFGFCDTLSDFTASGSITNFQGAPLRNVSVLVNGDKNTELITDQNGQFELIDARPTEQYQFTPMMEGEVLDGVTTYDLVVISKFILGENTLGLPYQRIAADVNNSGSISSLDIIQLRKVILRITDVFPNNTNWRFVDANYDFQGDVSRWLQNFPEQVEVTYDPDRNPSHDFIAVKTGDVNASNRISRDWAAQEQRTAANPLSLKLYEEKQSGVTEVAIRADAPDELDGFQFTIEFDPDTHELTEIVYPGALKDDHLGLRYIDQGLIAVSYVEVTTGQPLAAQQDLLRLKFRRKSNEASGKAFILRIGSRLLTPEAYAKTGTIRSIEGNWDQLQPSAFEVLAVYPNPVSESAQLTFEVFTPGEGAVLLDVFDTSGKRIASRAINAVKGSNKWIIPSEDLPIKGLYLYKLQYKTDVKTGKFFVQ